MMFEEDMIEGLEREFAVFVRQDRTASGQLGRRSHPEFTVSEYGLLAHLADRGPRRPTELACHVGVTPPSVSRQLQHLETLGFVERLQALDDGRACLVALTDKGRRRAAEVQAARSRRLRELLQSWPEHDVHTLAALLARFNSDAAKPSRRCSRAGEVQA